MLQSSYTSRRLADRIRIQRLVDTDQETREAWLPGYEPGVI